VGHKTTTQSINLDTVHVINYLVIVIGLVSFFLSLTHDKKADAPHFSCWFPEASTRRCCSV